MNRIQQAYRLGKAAAQMTFKAVPPPKPPKAPEPQQQKAPPLTKPTDPPVATPRPTLAPLPPPSPAQMVASQTATQMLNPLSKDAQFNYHCVPPPRPEPDEVHPDNGKTYRLKDNFATPLEGEQAINSAWSSIDTPAPAGNNPDILDSGLGGPPAPWDM